MKTREEMLAYIPKNTFGAEIGVFEGEFSKLIIETVCPQKFFMVDIFTGQMVSGDKNGENMKNINLDESYNRLCLRYVNDDRITLYKGKSDNFFNEIPDNYLDFVYIDGDHSYNGVQCDLQLAYRKVKPDGIICGHDYTGRFQGVVDAVNEFVAKNNFTLLLTEEDKCPSFFIKNVKCID